MPELKQHTASYYADTQCYDIRHPVLSGDIDVDVCIIGAGITGCSAALSLAESGFKVAVIESRKIGWGASGRSGGQKIAGYGCDLKKLRSLVGDKHTQQLWELSVEAVRLLDNRIARYDIACDVINGHLHVGTKARHDHELLHWYQELTRDYGYDNLQFLSGHELHEVIGSDRYTSGLLDPGGGHIHPLNYVLGLARAAQHAGVQFYEATTAKRIDQGHRPIILTHAGRIQTNHVVLAANAHIDGLEPAMRRYIMPVGTYIIATEPLGEQRARRLLPSNVAVADINFVLDYFRLSADHRLLFGGQVSYSGVDPVSISRSIRKRMLRVFPELGDVRIDYAWGGQVAITRNRAPHFGQLARNIYFAQGFSGHGIALAGLAGQLMAEAIAGREERFDVFARIPHVAFPGGRWLRMPLLVAAMTLARLRDALP